MAVRVVTDSTSYIPPEQADALGIAVVPLSVTLGGVTQDEREVDSDEFYRRMRGTGEFPTSSQPSVAVVVDALETPVAEGDDVVAVTISSKMSGTYDTALMARDQVLERHPGAVIEIVDSRSNSMEEGFAVLAAARTAAEGASAAEAVAAARRTIARTRWLFTPATLDYLRMGGRIGNAAALLGAMLQISPVLTVVDGVTSSLKQVRTHRRALVTIAESAAADFASHGFVDAVVHHVLAPDEGEALATMIEERSGHRPRVQPLGPAVAVHVGPGSLGVVYETREELHKNSGES
jgi:DegV family protein with EDD domain